MFNVGDKVKVDGRFEGEILEVKKYAELNIYTVNVKVRGFDFMWNERRTYIGEKGLERY